jgi:two-component system sensor kinase FixL
VAGVAPAICVKLVVEHLDPNTKHPFLLRLLQGNRTLVLLRAAVTITAIAVVDWRFDVNISFGFLYLFPMLMVGSCLTPWQIAGVAAICTGLVEAFDSFPWVTSIAIPRMILTFAAFTAAGLYVFESARNRMLANQHLADVEHEMDLRREAEAQLKVLIDSSPACIFTVDAGGKVLLANEAAHRLLGLEAGKLAGRSIDRYFPALTNIPFPQGESRLFRTAMECRGKRHDGSVFLAQVWFSTYRTSAGPRLAAVVFDSSDELRDREEFSLQHLLAGSRILVSAVCHEIRNLCGAIAAVHAQLLRDPNLKSNEDFRTLGSLLEGLLRIAGLELRESNSDAEYIDVGPVLEELRIVIESGFREAGIAVDWQIGERLPSVWAARQELLQAFLNITKNSQRAIEKSAIRKLTIRASFEEGSVLVRFMDTGPGVAEPERLFKPFQPGAEANGLGLYLSRAFVRSFRGDIQHEVQPSGACFAVLLTTAAEPRAPASKPQAWEEDHGDHSSALGGRSQPVSRES